MTTPVPRRHLSPWPRAAAIATEARAAIQALETILDNLDCGGVAECGLCDREDYYETLAAAEQVWAAEAEEEERRQLARDMLHAPFPLSPKDKAFIAYALADDEPT